jgi:four helix bundle protein
MWLRIGMFKIINQKLKIMESNFEIIYASEDEKRIMKIQDLALDFAKRIVELYKYLKYNADEYVISNQILRSGTSVGANISESKYPQSDADYLSKMNIALKEASETEFWLMLLRDCHYITKEQADSLLNDCSRIIKILICIVRKVSSRIKK